MGLDTGDHLVLVPDHVLDPVEAFAYRLVEHLFLVVGVWVEGD